MCPLSVRNVFKLGFLSVDLEIASLTLVTRDKVLEIYFLCVTRPYRPLNVQHLKITDNYRIDNLSFGAFKKMFGLTTGGNILIVITHTTNSNSPQRLLPLISTVTTATTSKSGSRETDLFF